LDLHRQASPETTPRVFRGSASATQMGQNERLMLGCLRVVALAAIMSVGDWIANHVGFTLLALTAFILGLRSRRIWLDALAVLYWRVASGRNWKRWVLGAERLIERRARRAACNRPLHETPLRYFSRRLAAPVNTERDALVSLGELSEWATYAPADFAPLSESEIWSTCSRAVRVWTYRRILEARRTA
jgi:hypothetical protein